ncbi:hypothetical protein L1887_14600 [Cichorium endivia]|nr:hypothetical protein L1887_14600 [Cichorium endivia]
MGLCFYFLLHFGVFFIKDDVYTFLPLLIRLLFIVLLIKINMTIFLRMYLSRVALKSGCVGIAVINTIMGVMGITLKTWHPEPCVEGSHRFTFVLCDSSFSATTTVVASLLSLGYTTSHASAVQTPPSSLSSDES